MFTQTVQAIDPNGDPYPAVIIDPVTLPNLNSFSYEIGRDCRLVIRTNLIDAPARGIDEMAAVIRRCYSYLERATGGHLRRGVLLYLIEFEQIPLSYRFTAGFKADCPWSEVRLALLERGQPLLGNRMGRQLAEFIYDTLPHELGHEILENFGLDQAGEPDTDQLGTRWFNDGVCELLAKGFCRSEQPGLWPHHIGLRKIDTLLNQPAVHDNFYRWSMQSDLPVDLESDLYGAAFLVMSVWTEHRPLPDLLKNLSLQMEYYGPQILLEKLQADTGLSTIAVLEQAHRLGVELAAISAAANDPRIIAIPAGNQLTPR
jgi:hypothetical protein